MTECAGCLDMEELGEILTGVGGGYTDITGMRLDAVKEDTKLTGVREERGLDGD